MVKNKHLGEENVRAVCDYVKNDLDAPWKLTNFL